MSPQSASTLIAFLATLSLGMSNVSIEAADTTVNDEIEENDLDVDQSSDNAIRSEPELEVAVSSLDDSDNIIQIDSLVRAGLSLDHAILRIFAQTVEDEISVREWFDSKVAKPCENIKDLYTGKREEIDALKQADRRFKFSPFGSLDQTCDDLLATGQRHLFND